MLMKKKLSGRLMAIARFIEENNIKSFFDIGTDHCYLPIYLADKCDRIIACDKARDPLDRARENVYFYGRCDRITLRMGNGFDALFDNEVQAAVIAGMGGREISKILLGSIPVGIRYFIIQPMNNYQLLRRTCLKRSLKIDNEFLLEDSGRIYLTVVCSYGGEYYSDFDYMYGKFIPYDKSAVSKRYLEKELLRLQKIYSFSDKSILKPIIDKLKVILYNF